MVTKNGYNKKELKINLIRNEIYMQQEKTSTNTKSQIREIIVFISIFVTLVSVTLITTYFQHKAFMEEVRETPKKYADYMQMAIKKRWHPPLNAPNATVLVEYTILKNGEITNVQILQSSKNDKLDKSAIDAIKRTKLPPFPDQIDRDSVTTYFTFNKNK